MTSTPGTPDPGAILRQLAQTLIQATGPASSGPAHGFVAGGLIPLVPLHSQPEEGLRAGQQVFGTLRQGAQGLRLERPGQGSLSVSAAPESAAGRSFVFRVRESVSEPVLQIVREASPAELQAARAQGSEPARTLTEARGLAAEVRDVLPSQQAPVSKLSAGRSEPALPRAAGSLEAGPPVRVTLSPAAAQILTGEAVTESAERSPLVPDADGRETLRASADAQGAERAVGAPLLSVQAADGADRAETSGLEREAASRSDQSSGLHRIDLDLSALGVVRLEIGTVGGRLRLRLGAEQSGTVDLLRDRSGDLQQTLSGLASLADVETFQLGQGEVSAVPRRSGLDLWL